MAIISELVNSNKLNKIPILIFSLIPLFYVIGNAVLDIAVCILAIYSISLFRLNIFKTSSSLNTIYLILIITSLLTLNSKIIIDSILYFRFFAIIPLIIYFLKNDQNENYFLISCLITTIIVSLTNIYQYNFEYLPIIDSQINRSPSGEIVRVGGLFRDELISGAYLMAFSPLALIYMDKINVKLLIKIIYILLVFIAIIYSGERISLLSFLLVISIYFISNIKKRILIFLCLSLTLLLIFMSNYYLFKRYTLDFYNSIIDIQNSHYWGMYTSALLLSISSLKSFLFGMGADSFEIICNQFKTTITVSNAANKNYYCSTHPHNIYIETLFSTGIFGLLTLIVFYIKITYSYIRNKSKLMLLNSLYLISTIVFFLPIKSSGSIFSQRFGFLIILFISLAFLVKEKLNGNQ
jgi:O-antigen ligase